MKLSASTLEILKNFSTINTSIVIQPGDRINTMAVDKNIVASAGVVETFDRTFGVYDLNQFLNVMSLFTDADISFRDTKQALIKEGKTTVYYTFADPNILTKAPSNVKELPPVATFELTKQTLQSLMKGISIMGFDQVMFQGDGEKLTLAGINSKNPQSDSYRVEVGDTDKEFNIYIKKENLVMIPGTYNVQLNNRNIHLISTERDLKYWIAFEMNSKV